MDDLISNEINKRLKSDNWNNLIAKKVLLKKRKKKYFMQKSGLVFSMATIFVIIGYFAFLNRPYSSEQISLINTQISGIQEQVYKTSDFEIISASSSQNTQKEENIDSLIMQTLSSRR